MEKVKTRMKTELLEITPTDAKDLLYGLSDVSLSAYLTANGRVAGWHLTGKGCQMFPSDTLVLPIRWRKQLTTRYQSKSYSISLISVLLQRLNIHATKQFYLWKIILKFACIFVPLKSTKK